MDSIYNEKYINTTYKEGKSSYPAKFCQMLFQKYATGSRVLDMGCGNGHFTEEMIAMGLDAHGIDIHLANGLGERFVKVDLQHERYPFDDESFDVIFTKSVIEHMQTPEFLFKEAHRLLRKDGVFICMTPSWKHTYKEAFYMDHTHVRPFTKLSLDTLMELHNFEGRTKYFFQLPVIWKVPSMRVFISLTNLFCLPYRPFHNIPWPETFNKWIRFSREAMLINTARKKA